MPLADNAKRVLLKPVLLAARQLTGGKQNHLTLRRGIARIDTLLGDKLTGVTQSKVELEHCSATWFDVIESRPDHVIFYIHGGGFIFETPALHSAMLARFCRDTASRGFMLHYRLAPEFPYPAATEDCLSAYRFLLANGHAPGKIVIAGDSAGGNLTLVTLLRIREAGLPLPAGAIALSPLTDATGGSDSFVRNAKHDPIFTPDTYGLVMDNYLADSQRRGEPWASPLLADLTGLPPIHLVVGSSEMLLDDSVRFAVKCPSASLEVWHDMPHVFPAMSFLPEAQDALTRLGHRITAMYAGAIDSPQRLAAPLATEASLGALAAPREHAVLNQPAVRSEPPAGHRKPSLGYVYLALAVLGLVAGGTLTGAGWWWRPATGSLWALLSQGALLVTVLAFVMFDPSRLALRRRWFSVGITLLFGIVCGLPFFLFMRERQLQRNA